MQKRWIFLVTLFVGACEPDATSPPITPALAPTVATADISPAVPLPVSRYSNYCSKVGPQAAWTFTYGTADPCLSGAGDVQRSGVYSTAGMNNVVVWCEPRLYMSFRGLGKVPLDQAKAAASNGRHMGGCVFVASPAHMPEFDWPFSPNAALPANYHGSGFDFERPAYGELFKVVDYRGHSVQMLDDHDAHDFGMAPGTPLLAVADGVVITAGMFYGQYSNCNVVPNLATETGKSDCGHQGIVIVRHTIRGSSQRYDEVFATGYFHVQSIPRSILSGCTPVDTGGPWPGAGGVCSVPVKKGQVIAFSGRRATNVAHLHFATWRLSNNARRDWLGYRAPDAALHSPNCCNSAGAIGPTIVMEPYGWRGVGGDPWSYKARTPSPTFPFGAGALSIRLWKTDPPIHWQ